jgi:AcrR family transcriptional regulator
VSVRASAQQSAARASAPRLSVTATARRQQIIAATVEVIAADGYRQASFARIAERAGLSSTRLISYHFAGKTELMSAVADHVITQIGAFMTDKMASETTAAGRLRCYIEGTVEFIAGHRSEMTALLAVFLSGEAAWAPPPDEEVVGPVESILRQGQLDSEFRAFDAHVVAIAVQRAVEGLPFMLQSEPDLDCVAYGRELADLFERATRS